MAAPALLLETVDRWERRRRVGVTLRYLPHALLPGLLAGVILASVARVRPALPDRLTLLMTVFGMAAGALALVAWVWLIRTRTPVESARWFDVHFGLQERISTALELLGGRIGGDSQLTARQIADAETTAARIDEADLLPLRTDTRVWMVNLVLVAAFGLIVAFIAPAAAPADAPADDRAAITAAADALAEIIQELAADPDLTDEERKPLLETLQTQLETLRDPDLSLDEALATLGEVQNTLGESAAQHDNDIRQQQEAEALAASALESVTASPETQPLSQTIENVEEALGSLTPDELADAADALEQAAEALAGQQPQTAEALQDAADALRQGDSQAAQNALQEAAAQAQRAATEQASRQRQQQTLQESAQQASRARQQAAQEGRADDSGEPTQGGGSESSEAQGEQAGGSTGESAAEGDTAGEGAASPDASQPGEERGTQDGERGQGSEGQGSGEGDLTQDASGRGSSGSDGSGDSPPLTEASEREYQAVFSPHFSVVEPTGDDEVRLGAEPGDEPLSQGEFDDNPRGVSVVPYNRVFSDYADAASRALESDYIPLGMRDAVHRYFSSLDPQQP